MQRLSVIHFLLTLQAAIRLSSMRESALLFLCDSLVLGCIPNKREHESTRNRIGLLFTSVQKHSSAQRLQISEP